MTRRRLVSGIVAAVVLVIGVYFVAFRSDDESKIRAQLAKLAAAVRVTADDVSANPIGRFAHVNDAFSSLFDPEVRVSIPELTSLQSGRRALAEVATSAPRVLRSLDVDFSDVVIKLDDAKSSALVGVTANVSATEQGGRVRSDKRAADFRFAKTGGDWIITSLTVWPPNEARF